MIITGKKLSDTEERRYSTAAKMVFGREELDRYGDSSVAEVLKRLPGITISGTPGRGGDIRMRGLGKGYTQILINGEPAPRGFSLDSLAPDQVERVEVMRGPIAEHSARAIAGTINIVMREGFVKRGIDINPTLGWEGGHAQPGISMQRSGGTEERSYSLGANVMHRDLPSESATQTLATDIASGAPVLNQRQQDHSNSVSDGLHLNARINWRLGEGNTLAFQPFLMQWRSNTVGSTRLDQSIGSTPAPYATAVSHSDSDYRLARGTGNLKLKLDDGAKLELRFTISKSTSDGGSDTMQSDASGGLAHRNGTRTATDDTSVSTSGKYSQPLVGHQQFATGWEAEFGNRQEAAATIQDGINPLARYGNDFEAHTRRLAAYAQDEWDISPLWSVYGGLRWEGIRTLSSTAAETVANQSSVVSPLFHSVWRFSQESKDQVRLGLTRSYRSPTLTNLVAVPTLSGTYPATGTNTPTNADSVGNPRLKPELAWGLDLAYEHYFSAGGLVSASVFRRDIDDLIRTVTTLQTVSWSPQQRWVASPTNLGRATSQGFELEAKFRLDELVADAPPLSLRSNYSRFWSRVGDVPGPNNRLDQQPAQTANVGLDYKLRALPVTIGGSINWTPAFTVQQTDSQIYYQGIKRIADIYALWKLDGGTQLRLTATNLLHADYDTANREFFAGTDQLATTTKKTFRTLSARLEIKL